MTETTVHTRQPYNVRAHDRGADIWSGPTDNDVIFGTVYSKGPGSYDHEEMAKVWAAAFPVMFPALAGIRNTARMAVAAAAPNALDILADIAEKAAAALPVPTIGDVSRATPDALSSPAPAVAMTVPVGWLCEDLILANEKPLLTNNRERAERRAEETYKGNPAWRVTPVYADPGAATPQADALTEAFQQRVRPWMLACFGEQIAADATERNHRFLEEALELVQSCGCAAGEAHQLVDYVYGRPVGERAQEVGGVMVTLAALCLAQVIDMHEAGETELARIWTKVDAIRAKQAAKPKNSPLPGPSATPPAGERRKRKEMEARATTAEAALSAMTAEMEAERKRYLAGIQRRHVRFYRMLGRAEEAEGALHALRHEIIEAAYKAWPDAEDVGYDAGNIIEQLASERDASQERERTLREALAGLADVMERDCDVQPCAASMAPAERYLGIARNLLQPQEPANVET